MLIRFWKTAYENFKLPALTFHHFLLWSTVFCRSTCTPCLPPGIFFFPEMFLFLFSVRIPARLPPTCRRSGNATGMRGWRVSLVVDWESPLWLLFSSLASARSSLLRSVRWGFRFCSGLLWKSFFALFFVVRCSRSRVTSKNKNRKKGGGGLVLALGNVPDEKYLRFTIVFSAGSGIKNK